MKPILIFLFAFLAVRLNAQTVINDKNVQVRNVSSFSALKVSGGIDVFLSQSNENAVAVSASDVNDRDQIKTEVDNGVLKIFYDSRSFRLRNKQLRAYISFKDLEGIEGSGATDFTVTNQLSANSIKIKLSGASDMKGLVNIDNAQIDLSGASTMKINGAIQNMKIEASGASDLKNYDLVVDNCIADLSGASDVKVTVNKSISAKASGASNLDYKGTADVRNISSSGASNISKRD
ncbi:MAG: head GIN domain-containing protein [Ginsengibacter sp.]